MIFHVVESRQMTQSEGSPHSLTEIAPEMRYSPNDMQLILKQPVSWSVAEDRPVTLEEYISGKLPGVAISLGITQMKTTEPLRRVGELTPEEQQKLTLAQLDSDDGDDILVAKGIEYTRQDVITGVRTNTGIGPDMIRIVMQERDFFLNLVEAGKLQVDPNAKDMTDIDYPEFLF